MKLELMANRQASELETESGLFEPDNEVADIDVTYLHAGLQFPFARSRNATPYVVVSAGLANLDPQISGVSAENRFSASAGVGVKLPMSRALSFSSKAAATTPRSRTTTTARSATTSTTRTSTRAK